LRYKNKEIYAFGEGRSGRCCPGWQKASPLVDTSLAFWTRKWHPQVSAQRLIPRVAARIPPCQQGVTARGAGSCPSPQRRGSLLQEGRTRPFLTSHCKLCGFLALGNLFDCRARTMIGRPNRAAVGSSGIPITAQRKIALILPRVRHGAGCTLGNREVWMSVRTRGEESDSSPRLFRRGGTTAYMFSSWATFSRW
jgi:hypothetical protein